MLLLEFENPKIIKSIPTGKPMLIISDIANIVFLVFLHIDKPLFFYIRNIPLYLNYKVFNLMIYFD